MQPRTLSKPLVAGFLLLCSAEGIVLAAWLLSIPADARNAVLLGYSLTRLGLFVGMAALSATLLWLGLRERTTRDLERLLHGFVQSPLRHNLAVGLALLLAAALAVALLTPAARFGRYFFYFERLQPLGVWVALALFQTVGLLALLRPPVSSLAMGGPQARLTWRALLLVGLVALALWGLVSVTGLGVTADQHYWNEAGVPLLAVQVLLALLLTWLLQRAGRALGWFPNSSEDSPRRAWPELVVFLLLWLVAALLWALLPQQPHPWAPTARPPNLAYYPISDSLEYYINAQFAVIGQKLGNGGLSDKPLYSILLFLLQLASGGRYNLLLSLQTAVLALFVPLVYLLGRQLHSRPAGLLLALLAILHEVNSIRSTAIVGVPAPWVLMSEELARIGLVLLALLLAHACRARRLPGVILAVAGGMLGLNTLLRYNAWMVLPPVLALVAAAAWRRGAWKVRMALPAVFLIGCLVGISGWMVREGVMHGNTLFFLTRFQSTVVSNRYQVESPSAEESAMPEPEGAPEAESAPAAEPPDTAAPRGQPGDRGLPPILNPDRVYLPLPKAMANHYLHNLVSSVVTLPLTLSNDTLYNTIKRTPVYSLGWDGGMRPSEIALALAGLGLITLGVVAAWKRARWAGLVPLVIFLGYHAGNAVALTSGNRYVTPVLWALFFYYTAGLLEAAGWSARLLLARAAPAGPDLCSAPFRPGPPPLDAPRLGSTLAILALLMLTSLGFSFLDWVVPSAARYPAAGAGEITAGLLERGALDGYTDAGEVEAFLTDPVARVIQGRAIFPRFYQPGEGDVFYNSRLVWAFMPQPYSRLVWHMLDARGVTGVVMPTSHPPGVFPDQADAVVLGCQRDGYVEALMVVLDLPAVGGAQPVVYGREPQAGLACSP